EERIRARCWLNVLFQIYRFKWNAYENTKKKQVYFKDYIYKIFGFTKDTKDFGLTNEEVIEKFFIPNKLGIKILNRTKQVMLQYPSEEEIKTFIYNHTLAPRTLYVMDTGSHIQVLDHKLKKLQQIYSETSEKRDDLHEMKVTDRYYVNEDFTDTPHYFINDVESFTKLDLSNCGERNRITCLNQKIEDVLAILYCRYDYIPKINCFNQDNLSSIVFKDGDEHLFELTCPESCEYLQKLALTTPEQYEQYQRKQFELNQTIINKKTKSKHNDIFLMSSLALKALNCCINPNVKDNHYVDMKSAYLHCMFKLRDFPVLSIFDECRKFEKDDVIKDDSFYLVQRVTKTSQLTVPLQVFLYNSYAIFRGVELKKRNGIFKHINILAWWEVSNTVSAADCHSKLNEIRIDDILTIEQFKTMYCHLTGHLEKKENTREESIPFTDKEEAEFIADLVGDSSAVVYPFEIQEPTTRITWQTNKECEEKFNSLLENDKLTPAQRELINATFTEFIDVGLSPE